MTTLKIRVRDRHKQGSPYGLRCGWTEYQLVRGHTVLSRHDNQAQAEKAWREALQQMQDPQRTEHSNERR